MKDTRKIARDYLKQCTLQKYNYIFNEAHLTERQQKILELHTQGKFNYQIGMDMDLSQETIRNELRTCFDKVYKVLEEIC